MGERRSGAWVGLVPLVLVPLGCIATERPLPKGPGTGGSGMAGAIAGEAGSAAGESGGRGGSGGTANTVIDGGAGTGGFGGLFVPQGGFGGFSGVSGGGTVGSGGDSATAGKGGDRTAGRGGDGATAGKGGGATGGSSGSGGTRAAAGSSGGGPGNFVSGTRLRAIVDDAGGGAKIWLDWDDQLLGKECRFLRMADGTYGCVPWDTPRVAFLDPGCTEAVIDYPEGGATPRWGIDVTLAACSVQIVKSVYVPAASLSSVPSVIYIRDGGQACSRSSPYAGIYLQATPATASPFVGATAGHETNGGDVAAETLTASDGAQQTIAGWDLVRDAECVPASALWGQLFPAGLPAFLTDGRCVPREAALNAPGEYADSACTMALVDSRCPSGAAPKVAIEDLFAASGGSECAFGVHDVGAAVDTTHVFSSTGGGCAAVTLSGGVSLFVQGPPVAANQYPILGRIETGTGRIKVRNFAAASGPPIGVQPHFYDSTLGVDCSPMTVTSPPGTICFPDDARSLSYNVGLFADAACSVKLFAWTQRCGLSNPSFIMKDSTMLVRAVPYAGTSVYANGYNGITGCVPTTPPSGTTLFAAGDPVPAGTFAGVVETTE